jgi:hypothetical protein
MRRRILIYYGDTVTVWTASSTEAMHAAFRELFKLLDAKGRYVDEDKTHLEAARLGDRKAIRGILESNLCNDSWELDYLQGIDE